MVVDYLSNLQVYDGILGGYRSAIEDFVKSVKNGEIENGKHNIVGDDLYASVQEYNTKEHQDAKWESHEKYIDLQYIAKGKEIIKWHITSELETSTDYNVEKDIIFYKAGQSQVDVILEEDMFTLLFPKDAHKPGCKVEESEQVKKIVFKIKIK